MKPDKEVIDIWSNAAPYWEKHRDTIRSMFHPITMALIEDARIEQGHRVLDVATGPGEPALSIAEAVGPSGEVVGIDPIPGMIEAARRAANNKQLHNARFEVATADELSYSDGYFDAAVSRFGVMFFPAPVDGVRGMLRVLKPNRKIAFAVWHFPERNPFHCVLSRVVDRYIRPEPPPPDSPDAFRFAEPGKLLKILGEAGAVRTAERLLQFNIATTLSPESFWSLRLDMSDKLRKKIANVSEEQAAAIGRDVIADLAPYTTERGISLPAEVLIVSGWK